MLLELLQRRCQLAVLLISSVLFTAFTELPAERWYDAHRHRLQCPIIALRSDGPYRVCSEPKIVRTAGIIASVSSSWRVDRAIHLYKSLYKKRPV